MTEEERELHLEKIDKLKELGIKKGFRLETTKIACMIAISHEMEENYGDYLKAMDKIIEICEHTKTAPEFLSRVMELAGYKHEDNGNDDEI